MKLIGNFLSPFARRVAISLNALGLPYEMQTVFVSKEPEQVRPFNPMARIPVLVLDDGERLVESYAILDEIDQMVGPERALTPPSGKERRTVMQITAMALAATEKAQWAFYERRFKPEDKVHQPWIDHNDRQVLVGLEVLDARASAAGSQGWLAGTPRMSQADVTAVVAFTYAAAIRPDLDVARAAPGMAAFAERCERMDAFARAPLP